MARPVDDDDDIRKLFRDDDVPSRGTTISVFVHLDGENLPAPGLTFPLHFSGSSRVPLRQGFVLGRLLKARMLRTPTLAKIW